MNTCAWDREGKSIAGGIGDGSIQVMVHSDLITSFKRHYMNIVIFINFIRI